jgi:hypothetical protein
VPQRSGDHVHDLSLLTSNKNITYVSEVVDSDIVSLTLLFFFVNCYKVVHMHCKHSFPVVILLSYCQDINMSILIPLL